MPTNRRSILLAFVGILVCVLPTDGAEILETPKSIRIVYSSGKTVSGLLVEQSGAILRVRLRLNERPVTIFASDVSSIVSDGKTYKYKRDKRRWEAVGDAVPAKAEKPASKVVASKDTKEKMSGSVPATLTVMAEGVGTTPDEARKDAIREAVRKVAGALVIGSTTVENDKIIQDKVLTYSDGVIVGDSYKELARKKEGDIWRIKIRATVINRKVADRLVDAGFDVRKIDGEGMAAAVLSRVEARKRATELTQAALEDFPKVVMAQAVKPTERDYDEDTGELKLTIQIAADIKRYEIAANRLITVLDKVAVDARRATYVGKVGKPEAISSRTRRFQRDSGNSEPKLSILPVTVQKADDFLHLALPEEKKGWYMWVMTNCKKDNSAVAWNVYYLDCVHEEAIKHLAGKPMLVVTLLDKEKNVLATKELDLSYPTYYRREPINGWMFHHTTTSERTIKSVKMRATHNVGIAPLYILDKSFSAIQGAKVPIKISEAELRKLDNIRCVVEYRK